MQILLLILFLFLVGCFLGWFIEVLFRRLVTAKKWVNPGFMKGPWLPLYGFGLVVMFVLCFIVVSLLPEDMGFYNPVGGLFGIEASHGPSLADLLPIALMWLGMNALEFLAGLIFIKGFHVKLWDYTNMKGNIMGIVCPQFSLIWFAVAATFYYALNPFVYALSVHVYGYMFGTGGVGAHFGFIFALGLLYGLFLYDLVVSLGVFSAVTKMAKESGLVARYEELSNKINEATKEGRKKFLIEHHLKKPAMPAGVKKKIEEMVFIDPDYEHHKPSNYDENGRPIKTNDETNPK